MTYESADIWEYGQYASHCHGCRTLASFSGLRTTSYLRLEEKIIMFYCIQNSHVNMAIFSFSLTPAHKENKPFEKKFTVTSSSVMSMEK